MIENLRNSFKVQTGHLPCGDYLINDRILVERKTARDLSLSIIDTHLFRQVRKLKNATYRSVLIIEGDPFLTDLDMAPAAIQGALLSIKAIWQLPVIFSKSINETVDILVCLAYQDIKTRDVLVLRGGYRPRRLRTRQLYFLQGLPDIGPVLAKRLLERFGTPRNVLAASRTELASVKGIGRERAFKIRQLLEGEKY